MSQEQAYTQEKQEKEQEYNIQFNFSKPFEINWGWFFVGPKS